MGNKISAVIFLVLFFLPLIGSASDNFDKGVNLYKANDFKESSSYFLKEINESGITGELAFNVGNCFFKLKEYSKALLWYKKAEKYLFANPDLKFNKHVSMENLGLEKGDEYFLSDYVFFPNFFLPAEFINWCFIFCEILLFSLVLFFSKKLFKTKVFLSVVSVFLLMNSLFNFYGGSFFKRAVILDNTEIHSAYSQNASILFSLKKGSVVKVKENKEGFCKIITRQGKPGWVLKKDLGII